MILQVPLFCLRHGTAAGLESSVSNLIVGLVQCGATVQLPVAAFERLNPEFTAWAQTQRNVIFKRFPRIGGGTWTRFVEECVFWQRDESSLPVIFPNYFLPPAWGRRRSSFVYIHDCQHRSFPQYFSRSKRLWLNHNFARTLDRATGVLLISEFERTQIARFFGAARADKCTVVYNPIDWTRYTRGTASPHITSLSESRYVLSVSHQYAHKNTETVIDAFVKLAGRFADLRLILVGRESANVRTHLAGIGDASVRERITLTGFIKDVDLGLLYQKSRLFVLASEYEGFGMPAVEAMGFGVPVVLTNGSSLPEVTLGAGTYVEPNSTADVWADAMAYRLETPGDAPALQRAALAVRDKFSPAAVATAVLKVVEHCA